MMKVDVAAAGLGAAFFGGTRQGETPPFVGLPKKGWSSRMKTDVHAVDILGCAMQGKGMHDQSITQMCIFLDKQFWHSLLDCWMQGQGSMSWCWFYTNRCTRCRSRG